jgi:hypothetical protein
MQIPTLSVTTGGTDVEWVEIPTNSRKFKRQPTLRLPLDPDSARRARRYIRFEPWSSMLRLVALLAWVIINIVDPAALSRPITFVVFLAVVVWSTPYVGGALPRQAPYQVAAGDLRVPDVPIEVAKQWVEMNSGVTPTIEPVARPRSRRWYATGSAVLLGLAIVLFVVLAITQPEHSSLTWLSVLILFLAGGAMALKTLPPGYIGFEKRDS